METHAIIDQQSLEKPKRSQFLTTLCILTFIMCCISILMEISKIYSNQPEVMLKNIEQMEAVSPAMADMLTDQMLALEQNPFLKVFPYLNIVFVLGSFLGALMMWNFKKMGFYIYSIAEILPYISMFFVSAESMNMPGMPSWVGPVGIVLTIIVDVIFVFLYSRNIEELR